nr:pentatricopeptide repeat-containing protein At2g06000-like [Tanacetum cinerariifolium]
GRFIEARDLLRQLKQRGDIVPKAFIYNPVIDGFCKAGNVDEANLIVTEMEENRCKPDKLTFTILIIGHCAKGRMVEAIKVAFRPSSVIGGMHRRTHQVISQMPYFRLSSVGSHISVFPSDAEGSLNKSKLHKSSLMFGQIACFVPNVTKVQGSSLWETFGASIVPVRKSLRKPLVESERASSLVCFPGEMVDAVSNYSIYQDIVLSDDLVLDGNQYIFLN